MKYLNNKQSKRVKRGMTRFFTADWHLCSDSVFKLAERPFKNVDHMNHAIMRNANQRAYHKDDVIYHLGDFYNKSKNKSLECHRQKYTYFYDKIESQMVMIEGNHDIQNNVKCLGKLFWMQLGKYNVSLGHFPTIISKYDVDLTPECYKNIGRNHIHICGHVHKSWKWILDEENMILNINVGIDVWKYRIVSESELIRYIETIIRNNIFIDPKRLFLKQ